MVVTAIYFGAYNRMMDGIGQTLFCFPEILRRHPHMLSVYVMCVCKKDEDDVDVADVADAGIVYPFISGCQMLLMRFA